MIVLVLSFLAYGRVGGFGLLSAWRRRRYWHGVLTRLASPGFCFHRYLPQVDWWLPQTI